MLHDTVEPLINGKPRDEFGERAQLAIDTLAMKPTKGIPQWMCHIMDIPLTEEIAGVQPGDYRKNPTEVYLKLQRNAGTCFIDQFLAENALSMGQHGYEGGGGHTATTGMQKIVVNDMVIDSPEAVVEHMEKHVFPYLERKAAELRVADSKGWRESLIRQEFKCQEVFGSSILKSPYGSFQSMPALRYGTYGYENYFMAYALYPEVWEKDFRLQGDLSLECNKVSAAAILEGNLPRVVRFDHDMADSRSTLVAIESLDRIWFPNFARCIQPFLDAGIRIIWHCDGNLMEMVPRLLEAGIGGFQGFQYEDGMDYERICRMTDRNGSPLLIWAGCSVTTTLPHGTRTDVIRELKFLVEKGPKVGLALGPSSSVAPNTNHENIKTWIEGMNHYRIHGRAGL